MILTTSVLGEKCTTTTQCAVFASYCGGGVCRCSPLLRQSGRGQCTLRHQRVVGEQCTRDSQCADRHAVCSRGECSCKIGFRLKTEDEFWVNPASRVQCVPQQSSLGQCDTSTGSSTKVNPVTTTTFAPRLTVKIRDKCQRDNQCPPHSACQSTGCRVFTCGCLPGFIASDDRNACTRVAMVGESCDLATTCLSRMAYCDGMCKCHPLFRATPQGLCRYSWRRAVEEECTKHSQCAEPNAVCVRGACRVVLIVLDMSLFEVFVGHVEGRVFVFRGARGVVLIVLDVSLFLEVPVESY
ncbi:latent-transforming growth factor beta-binding protein 1-like [Gigantopelta aegis]|uniref:latent-transforming growth factor beta-binding protein 1-like n=1 Tax=Gigantopelta aegis TaxID=1735272 RepID=UPI001B88E187|nr:latent-transforming growth factor beta-binding protein 1-like [Gigantopelta aegis]